MQDYHRVFKSESYYLDIIEFVDKHVYTLLNDFTDFVMDIEISNLYAMEEAPAGLLQSSVEKSGAT